MISFNVLTFLKPLIAIISVLVPLSTNFKHGLGSIGDGHIYGKYKILI